MRRRTFDTLMSLGGLAMTMVLLIAGSLLFVGYTYANNTVTSQLKAQSIFFPAADNPQMQDPRIGPFVAPYAGEQVVTGRQAEVYANHFIGVHLEDVAEGKTYSEVSTLSRANPDDATLAGQVQTLFRGETLRGVLLTAYAFWQLGQIALWGSIASFALAIVMATLTVLGFWHRRRVAPEEEILAPPRGLAEAV
ncbi:MAG TPA: hypothetical protein VM841_12455 [Actinomycetota bacterium]|nr:hypothetical protein [Actinomycetota bacterium]